MDVIPDGFDIANVAVGASSALLALAAFLISLWVQRRAARSVIDERRRLFELDILRDLAKDLDESGLASEVISNPGALARYTLRLDLLSERLPFWDQVLAATDHRAVADLLGVGPQYRQILEDADRLAQVFLADQERWVAAQEEFDLAPMTFPARTRAEIELTKKVELRRAERDSSKDEYSKANDRINAFRREAEPLLARRLEHDLRMLIWSRVEDPRELRLRSRERTTH